MIMRDLLLHATMAIDTITCNMPYGVGGAKATQCKKGCTLDPFLGSPLIAGLRSTAPRKIINSPDFDTSVSPDTLFNSKPWRKKRVFKVGVLDQLGE